VLNLLQRGLTDKELHDEIPQIRLRWKQVRTHNDVQVNVDGKTLTPEYCFDLRVNGSLFHQDLELAEEYERLPPMLQSLVHTQMVALVVDGRETLWIARDIADRALNEGLWIDRDSGT
jgi:hypothetical protein